MGDHLIGRNSPIMAYSRGELSMISYNLHLSIILLNTITLFNSLWPKLNLGGGLDDPSTKVAIVDYTLFQWLVE